MIITQVFRQMKAYADLVKPDQWSKVVVAYEPVWAIGKNALHFEMIRVFNL